MGGLSVWSILRGELPSESIVYYGDGANCPYGSKPVDEVFDYIMEGVEALVKRDVKMIVLACNTATIIAIEHLRKTYGMPFVGMEPAIKPAAASTESGIVGVLATKASLNSAWFAGLVSQYDDKVRIITGEGIGWVRIVEENREDSPEALDSVRKVLAPILEAGADRIVLGCTHYPFLIPRMREVVGERDIEFIDPAPAIAKRVKWLLDERGINAEGQSRGFYEFLTSGDEGYRRRLIDKAEAYAYRADRKVLDRL